MRFRSPSPFTTLHPPLSTGVNLAKRLLMLMLLALVTLSLSNCGYTVSSRGPVTGSASDAKPLRIRLATVKNTIVPPRPGLEFELTQRLKAELALDRRFELSQESADADVSVTLTGFKEPALVRDLDNTQTETALSAICKVTIGHGADRRDTTVSARSDYARGIREPREDGLERLWRELARNILDTVAEEDWLAPNTGQ